MEPEDAIAIVGMWGVFAGASTPEQLWANVLDGVDATSDVPAGRWAIDPAAACDPEIGRPDHVYSIRGGFIAALELDLEGLNLDRSLLDRLDPLFHLALHVARAAWQDARTDQVDPRRVGVVFGNIVLPTETASQITSEVLGRRFQEAVGMAAPEAVPSEPLNAFPAGLPAALVARALGLSGAAYTLDAACASSLYALKLAVDELRSMRADAMLTGGISRPDSLYTQMGFSQLQALSARGKPAPFDRRADGLVVGEGAGMFVLKRLADALRQKDHIHGLIAGIGLSNDIEGDLLAPSRDGQLRAMRIAYASAGWAPSDVDLIECHAPGTRLGDAVEVSSLKSLWREAGAWKEQQCVIGSVKSNVGHTLTAAGAAALLKVLLALQHRTLPPTANFERPSPALQLAEGPFRVLVQPEPWPCRAAGEPRRAAVSGFGFGGINAHVLIEEWIPSVTARPRKQSAEPSESARDGRGNAVGTDRRSDIAIVGMAAHFGPFGGAQAFRAHVLGGESGSSPSAPRNWWGVPESGWYRRCGWDADSFPGYYLDSLEFRVDEFRIPPTDLGEMLPQQALMLAVAAAAIRDSGWDTGLALRTGVLVGIGLDLNTTNYHLRWSLPEQAREWNKRLGLGLAPGALARWADELRELASPALSAHGTMGSLGGLIASRIARQFHIGGPSFTIACEENSGIQALAIAQDWLKRGELDAVVVGAVDFAGDVRAVLARHQLAKRARPTTERTPLGARGGIVPVACDGAICLIVKRLEDAQHEGARIYAVIRGVKTMSARPDDPSWAVTGAREAAETLGLVQRGASTSSIGYLEIQGPHGIDPLETEPAGRAAALLASAASAQSSCALGSIVGDLGQAGAAAGLASVAKAALCLEQQILPAPRQSAGVSGEAASQTDAFFIPKARQFWLRNRAEGPRRAAVISSSVGGQRGYVGLTEFASSVPASAAAPAEWSQPLGSRPCALFALEADDEAGITARALELRELARTSSARDIDSLARQWWRRHPNDPRLPRGLAIVCSDLDSLSPILDRAGRSMHEPRGEHEPVLAGSIHVARRDTASLVRPRLAFVYPGLGSHFEGMARELSALWPDLCRAMDDSCAFLRVLFDPALWWNGSIPRTFSDHRAPILGNVAVGSLVTDLLRRFGIAPDAAIGYSMGETTALVALGAWKERDGLLKDFRSSSLFQADLAGPCQAARRLWDIPAIEPVDWCAGIVACSVEAVREAIAGEKRVYALIRNTRRETVIGGRRPDVEKIVRRLGVPFVELPNVSTVHCEIGRVVETQYRALHDRETVAPEAVVFYSGAWGRSYELDRQRAAAAITAQATQTIDFAAVIERAYEDGIRAFLEVGPGGSCTRLIGQVLSGKPHVAWSATPADRDPLLAIMNLLGELIAYRLPVALGGLYGGPPSEGETREDGSAGRDDARRRKVLIEVRDRTFPVPPPPERAAASESPMAKEVRQREVVNLESLAAAAPQGVVGQSPAVRQLYTAQRATAAAHRAFLRTRQKLGEIMSKQAALELELIENWNKAQGGTIEPHVIRGNVGGSSLGRPVLDRAQCLEFAVGSITAVLGSDFAMVDRFARRVRLPAEPLMLVDRIVAIDGQPRSLGSGRVVTEHEIHADAWYFDGKRVPACIAIEAGQADLFLSGYLGVDFETRGLAVYRLLDATVVFHGTLPGPGAVIRYDIRITSFFRQGETILFRFQFDATVAGEPLLTMRDGCAGFFTAGELAAGRGILTSDRWGRARPGTLSSGEKSLVPLCKTQLSTREVEALRRGDLDAAFGPPFDRLPWNDPLPLPGGMMSLVHRVNALDPSGGPSGLGLIQAEADIHPDDWFMVCHFIDDRVMPGTLMYECCLHTLRILMMRMGWIGRRSEVAFEPVRGIATRLKCRGQVVESTRLVTYEVALKELGYRPEPYAVADALILADGKPIVEITDMALQLSGTSRHELERLWTACTSDDAEGTAPGAVPQEAQWAGAAKQILFDHERILEFAIGKPSAAFGAPYRPFDDGRFIARLPGPPYQFLHRITGIEAEPWVMAPGASAEAQFDIAADAWFFAADRQERLPLAVLLEVALQACGWLAAYMGSALSSDEDLKFRNLGGAARQHRVVSRGTGTLTTRVRCTKITSTTGLILQQYDFSVRSRDGLVYDGSTEFGFFPPRLLIEQVGLRNAAPYQTSARERAGARAFAVPTGAPFPDARWRMIEQVDELLLEGGPRGLGFVRGSIQVDPEAWFFKAHFLNDPVWPGSLGLESLLQLLKVAAAMRYGACPMSVFESPALGQTHRWTYRGQIVPANRRATVVAEITKRDDRRQYMQADGYLGVDDKIIYRMQDFSIRLDDPEIA